MDNQLGGDDLAPGIEDWITGALLSLPLTHTTVLVCLSGVAVIILSDEKALLWANPPAGHF